jgi:hypothetical protein
MNRPAAGVITRRPEEPCATIASTVLWELGTGNRPWLPDMPPARPPGGGVTRDFAVEGVWAGDCEAFCGPRRGR